MNNPEATQQALSILRSGETFQWYVLPLFAFVLYIYFNEISNKELEGSGSRSGAIYGTLAIRNRQRPDPAFLRACPLDRPNRNCFLAAHRCWY